MENSQDAIGLAQVARFRGSIIYDPALVTPDGRPGVYYYQNAWEGLSVGNSFALATRIHTVIAASMPLLEDNLALYFQGYDILNYQDELTLFKDSRIPLLFARDILSDTDFLALNPGEGYGRLRVLASDERPHPRDIALYEALPNELPRVAGIISTVPQTPLSHVNLRAIQDGIPNAFIRDARDDPAIAPLIDGFVRYEVTDDGWELHTATKAEVDAHYESARPAQPQTPERDLAVTGIKPLSQIGFEDWTAFGVKAANVAVLGTLRFPAGTVPDGFAIPFYFYDEFMKVHDFYTRIETMLADPDFQTDFDVQDDMLDDLRDDIEDADSPQWIVDDLTTMHATYPEGQSLRYRSSTNNEDLPGFNGAGLYDSKTQNPDETVEDGIDKSLKGVFASLWTFRAFTEREFYRIDHLAAAMGVLVHPNYKDELANGVAVSFDPTDPLYGNDDWYYVNTQVGEDLVTNPEAHSVPEEILIYKDGTYRVLAISNQVPLGQLLMSNAQLTQLRDHLTAIHDHFEALYDPATGEPFAMEIEFKITSEDILAIKQARPWVFGGDDDVTPPPPPPSGGGGPSQTVPGAPMNLVVEGGDGQVTLTWTAPEDDGGSEDHGLRVPDQRAGKLDIDWLHRHHLHGHRARQRYGLHLPGAGGEPHRQEPAFFGPGGGDTEDAGGSGFCAFRQWEGHHLRGGARESGDPAEGACPQPLSSGPPSDPARSLLLRSRRRADRSGIDGGCPGRSGDPRGRGADDPDGDGARWENSRSRPTAEETW